jgi:hypothetical protein
VIFKKLVSAFVVIVLTACGGGGGGGDASAPAAPPIPTPPPTPTDYPVSFYYGDRIDNFKACFDLNFNDRCDDNELSTTTFENPSNNDHSFVLSTNDTSLNNFLRQNKRPYLIEVNACDGCPPAAKSRHPGHLFLEELGWSTQVNMNTFTAAITPKFTWANFPGWYFDDPNSGAAKVMEADIYTSILNNLNLISEYEGISDAEFFGGIDSVNVMSSNRDNALSDRFFSYSFTSELRRLIANDYATIASGSDNLFFGVSLEGKTPDQVLVDFQPEGRVFRSYLSSNFPNDTTGKYSSLSTSDRYTMPGFFDVKIAFNDFIGNWDGNYTASGRTRLIQGASLYSFPLSASIPGQSASPYRTVPVYYGCDVADDNLCRHDATINGLFASAADAREIYRLDSHQGNIVDSYIDRYEIINSELGDSQDVMRYYQNCVNFQAAQRSEVDYQNISGTVSDVLYRRIETGYSGSNQNGICYVSDRTTIYSYTIMGLAAIAGQGDLVFHLQGNDPDYFYDIPSIDSVLSDLNSRNTLDSASLKYINDIEIDLDFVETLVERTKEGSECDICSSSLTIWFFPHGGSTSYNRFLLLPSEEVYCHVDYNGNYPASTNRLGYMENVTDAVIQDVLDFCKEFLSWGWEFEGENNLVRSPFMGGGVNANSASGLKPRNNSELSPEEKLELVRAHSIRR